jgi:hypothetical protein
MTESGIYSLCTNIWDDSEQKYTKRDTVDILKCCIDHCRVPVEFCHDECQKYYGEEGDTPNSYREFRCNETCNDQRVVCQEGCELGSQWGVNNPFIVCAKKKGCWSDAQPDIKCIKKHKDKLLNCCYQNCNDEDCKTLCQYTYELSKEPRDSGVYLQSQKYAPAKRFHEEQLLKYVIFGVLTGIFLYILFLTNLIF